MTPLDAFTDFQTVSLPDAENDLSRRYLRIATRWIPVAMSTFEEWPHRPDCGHFLGGVFYYGLDVATAIVVIASAASSHEFDPKLAGAAAADLRRTARKGLRFLCFTHDTGPPDCVRPRANWGGSGKKWGERGSAFFHTSQCGRAIASMAVTAGLIRDLLGDEDREMLATIAADYLNQFGEMPPKSGVFNDTQTEENAWTALGLAACLSLLPKHDRSAELWEQARLWMFRTRTTPRDSSDHAPFVDGKTVRQLSGGSYTTLPDGTAENHGFVHPSYMASGLVLPGKMLNVLGLYNQTIPPHTFFHMRDTYDTLKRWCDDGGMPHCLQGMDWPCFTYPDHAFLHAVANLHLKDSDAALLENRALEVVERSSEAHGGRMITEEVVRHCSFGERPTLMGERMSLYLANAYLAHRMKGIGETPSNAQDFERRMRGVAVYPHGGALIHRHTKGQTSLSWRNRAMVLPATREGLKLIGCAENAMLARVWVRDRPSSSRPVSLRVREGADRVCALFIEDIAQESVRRHVFFASLPDGRCLTSERLTAREEGVVERVEQGFLSVINDGFFGGRADLKGQRRLFHAGGDRIFSGYVSPSEADDEILGLAGTRWVNVDDRFGLVFEGTGRAVYLHRHYFKIWRAVEDSLLLNLQDTPQTFEVGDRIATLTTLWCPEQSHDETPRQALILREASENVFAAQVDGFLCACNFGNTPVTLPGPIAVSAGRPFPLSWGASGVAQTDLKIDLRLNACEPAIVEC